MSKGLLGLYFQGMFVFGISSAIGNVVRQMTFGKEEASDWSLLLGSCVVWPVAAPAMVIMIVDGLVNDARWNFKVKRVTTVRTKD